MKKLILIAGIAALTACGGQEAEAPANEMVAETDMAENAMTSTVSTAQSLNGTSWQFTMDDKQIIESIDDSGNYIADTAAGEHYDHGSYTMKDGKACFTSAMNEDGEVCWTGPDAGIGDTVTVTNDKGETLDVTRVDYRPLTMPS